MWFLHSGEKVSDEQVALINMYWLLAHGLVELRPNSATSHDLLDAEPGAGHCGLSGVPVYSLEELWHRSGLLAAKHADHDHDLPSTVAV